MTIPDCIHCGHPQDSHGDAERVPSCDGGPNLGDTCTCPGFGFPGDEWIKVNRGTIKLQPAPVAMCIKCNHPTCPGFGFPCDCKLTFGHEEEPTMPDERTTDKQCQECNHPHHGYTPCEADLDGEECGCVDEPAHLAPSPHHPDPATRNLAQQTAQGLDELTERISVWGNTIAHQNDALSDLLDRLTTLETNVHLTSKVRATIDEVGTQAHTDLEQRVRILELEALPPDQQPPRYRANLTTTSKGLPSHDVTVDGQDSSMTAEAVEEARNAMIERAVARYPHGVPVEFAEAHNEAAMDITEEVTDA